TAPSAPTPLTATAASASQIDLAWSASTDNVGVTGYRVERCQGAGCTTFAQVSAPTATSFNDTGLAAGTSYSYQVRATDAAGNLSAYSSVASATTQTPDTTAPTAPTGLSATAASSAQINLAWTASTDNVGVTGYRVERCQGAGCTTFAQIAAPTTTSFNNTGLAAAQHGDDARGLGVPHRLADELAVGGRQDRGRLLPDGLHRSEQPARRRRNLDRRQSERRCADGADDKHLDAPGGDLRRGDGAVVRERGAGGEPGADHAARDDPRDAADGGEQLRRVLRRPHRR